MNAMVERLLNRILLICNFNVIVSSSFRSFLDALFVFYSVVETMKNI